MRLQFGKHKGEHVDDLATEDPGYLQWLEEQPWLKDELREEINACLEAPTGRATSVGRVVKKPRPMTFDYCHPSLGSDGKPMSSANIIWAERNQGSAYYRTSKYAMKAGKFPPTHPCAPFDNHDSDDHSQMGDSKKLAAFRDRGYWASCFPEGDGITLKWWGDGGEGFDSRTPEQVMKDIQECFGWALRLRQ